MNERKTIIIAATKATKGFLPKIKRLIPSGQQRAIEAKAGLEKDLIVKWRRGGHVRLEDAWLLARALEVSLDSLADDLKDVVIRRTVEVVDGPALPKPEAAGTEHHANELAAKPKKSGVKARKRRPHRNNNARS
jgi:transcriptional regulator with XRE-family HTH domain